MGDYKGSTNLRLLLTCCAGLNRPLSEARGRFRGLGFRGLGFWGLGFRGLGFRV